MDCTYFCDRAKIGFKSAIVFLFLFLSILLVTSNQLFAAPSVEQSTQAPRIILDNTASFNPHGVITNLQTGYANTCSKSDAMNNRRCNSINVAPENFQVLRASDENDDLLVEIGADNPETTSYNNKGTDQELNLFEGSQHLINLNRVRDTADRISQLNPSLPEGSFGTINWQQFIENVANARTMYGIVRVKVPVQQPVIQRIQNSSSRSDDDDHDDDSDDDGDDDGQSDSHDDDASSSQESSQRENDSDDDGSDDDESDDDDHEQESPNQITQCDDSIPGNCECAPDSNTNIQAGEVICGILIPESAQVDVRGAILFDWVNPQSGNSLTPDLLTTVSSDLSFTITVPININPGSPRSGDQVMSNIDQIVALTQQNGCGSQATAPCSSVFNQEIPFYLVPQESKDDFHFLTGITLTSNVFRNLTKIEQYHLLFPSGYADGWALAFNRLGITAETWQSWGYKIPNTSGMLTADDVRSDAFEDIPALIYSGGYIDIHYHTNISGLVYAFQKLELEQNGLFIPDQQSIQNTTTNRPESDDDDHDDDSSDDGDDDSHGDDSNDDGHDSQSSSLNSSSSDDDGSDDDGSNDDGSDDDDHEKTELACGSKIEKDDDSHDDDDSSDDDGSDDDSHSQNELSQHNEKSSTDDHSDDNYVSQDSDHSDDDNHDDDESERVVINNCKSDDEGIEEIELTGTRYPAKQYISGALIVQDAFYLEAKYNGGATVVSNNASNYSNIVLSESSAVAGKFEAFPSNAKESSKPVNKATDYKFARQLAEASNKTPDAAKDAKNLAPGPQWIEIRPQ